MSHKAVDWRLFIEAWFELLLCAIVIRLPLRYRFLNLNESSQDRSIATNYESIILEVERAGCHHLKRMTCLELSLASQRMLCRRGIRTVIRYGVRQSGENVEAHAWLELSGKPIIGGYEDFVPME